MKMLTKFRALALVLPLVLTTMLSGCTGAESSDSDAFADMSRARLYNSTKELAADSAVVVVGTAKSETVTADIDGVTDFTLVDFVAEEVLQGSDRVAVGETVVVRQTGSAKQGSPAPLMTLGEQYLLYLTPSGLDGKLAEHYYVTGANAGLYIEREPGKFSQFDRYDGEDLPATLTREGALGK